MNKTIEQYTEIELKAMVYDHMASIERSQQIIKLINDELAKRAQKEAEKPVEEVNDEKK